MDKNDMFFWNEEKNRIDGFVPLDGDGEPQPAQTVSRGDPEQSYDAYLNDAYKEFRDETYGTPAYPPVYYDAGSGRQEADGAAENGAVPPAGGAGAGGSERRKRRRPPRMVTMGILCLCIVLAAVTGALSGIAVMQHYTAQNNTADGMVIPEGTHAGIGAITATILDAQLRQAADEEAETAAAQADAGTAVNADQTPAANAGVIKTIMDSVVCIKTDQMVDTFYGPVETSGAGSGVIISEDGYIVTCAHVVSGASRIEVQDSGNNVYEASLVACSDKVDLALLKIDAGGLTAAVLGNSDTYGTGDQIYVVGNPLGNFVLSVSQGIISGVDRQANIEGNMMRLTQVDAAVNPGNSGGGLFDSQGRLIGIVNAKNTGIDVEGMGFAIPIDTVREVLGRMLQRTDLTL